MSHESHWRTTSRRAIVAALEDGRAKGLDGVELERYVSRAYPFGERSHYPYKIFLHEFRRLVRGERVPLSGVGTRIGPKLVSECPLFPASVNRVHRLEPEPPRSYPWNGYRVWIGRLDLGDWLVVRYDRGRLTARTGNTLTAARRLKAVFDEPVCGPKDPPPAPSEVAGFLGGLFDFSALDLDELDGEAMKETRDA